MSSRCAAAATPAAVAKVPTTPIQTTGPTTVPNRRRPMFMPPSNRITASATVTIRSTSVMGSRPSPGHRSEASAEASRKIAGAGIRMRALIRLDDTASAAASAVTNTISANV